MQPGTPLNTKGIDISHWNEVIDFSAVKQDGVDFAYIKATEGNDYIDPMFTRHVREARTAGLLVGAYHYANPYAPFDTAQPYEEAEFFVRTMKTCMPDFGDLMPVLDLEEPTERGILTPDELVSWTWIFHGRLQELTNRRMMLYTGTWFVQLYDHFGYKLSDLPLWVAEYEEYGITEPTDCGGWTKWTVWQYTDSGQVNGIRGNVDLNYGPPSLEQLR